MKILDIYTEKKKIVEIIQKIGNERQAIERAEKLLAFHGEKLPLLSNPSTKVHLLIKELRDWIYFYNWKPEKPEN